MYVSGQRPDQDRMCKYIIVQRFLSSVQIGLKNMNIVIENIESFICCWFYKTATCIKYGILPYLVSIYVNIFPDLKIHKFKIA